ncbi:protein of unknown function (plasmid) [Pararobbsia alpina]
MKLYAAVDGSPISIGHDIEQLKIEHVLQRDRDVWVVTPEHPFLAIDADLLNARATKLTHFPVFSSGQLWQNVRRKDLGARLLASLAGGGVNAGFGPGSRAFVAGKANGKTQCVLLERLVEQCT